VDSGTDDEGRYYVAMAFVEGLDLDGLRALAGVRVGTSATADSGVRIPDKIVGFILFMILRALRYAHNYNFAENVVGLVHRDISPGNILLDEREGFVKLSDFGVAAVQGVEPGSSPISGKVPYMAPKILVEDPFDCRVDIYSLGLVAYELLTGFNPNVRPCAMNSVIGAITEVMLSLDLPLRAPHDLIPGIDEALSNIVVSMLEKNRDFRYRSAEAVMSDLGVFLFERGYGPTTSSLSAYIRLLRHPGDPISATVKENLRFLDWYGEADPVRPRWDLSPAAAADLASGLNPGRVHS